MGAGGALEATGGDVDASGAEVAVGAVLAVGVAVAIGVALALAVGAAVGVAVDAEPDATAGGAWVVPPQAAAVTVPVSRRKRVRSIFIRQSPADTRYPSRSWARGHASSRRAPELYTTRSLMEKELGSFQPRELFARGGTLEGGMRFPRRAFLSGLGGWLATSRAAWADFPKSGLANDCEVRDITVPGDKSRRFTLLVPKHLLPHERVPLLVLLHGQAECVDERLGAFAWVERYGLATAYNRLRRPPVARTSERPHWTDARVAEINAQLARRPFRGIAVACPFMPDLPMKEYPRVLEEYGAWIVETVIPRARREVPTLEAVESTTIGGCSLGGHFSLEIFLRRPEVFGAWSGVQTAISKETAPWFAHRMATAFARVGKRDVLVETSSFDPFLRANEELSHALGWKGIAHELRVLPGPHDQAWLREGGTLELLLWHDDRPRTVPRAPSSD